jgi:hypothetical protein
LSSRRHWQGFHNAWATAIAWDLNGRLPEKYFAEPNVQFGLEIDVATWEEPKEGSSQDASPKTPASEKDAPESLEAWLPPQPTQTVPFQLIGDIVEVAVYNTESGPVLVGALELVSPANKDRPKHRRAFVDKCRGYLQEGIGLAIVDLVTERRANLHQEMLQAASNVGGASLEPSDDGLYAVAYRPFERDNEVSLEIWWEPLLLGRTLPSMPLWLRAGPCLPIDLNGTYERTCRELRIS